jgi:hypothetical protein
MHDLEPWHGWRDDYKAEHDKHSPFYGNEYSDMYFTNQIYNFYIHPQWDQFGSETMCIKVLYADYSNKFCIIELIGEWNDAIGNDIMFLKRDVIDFFIKKDISRFVLICENVLNFHGDDDCYYEEWYDDVKEEDGWICLANCFDHVNKEMQVYRLQYYLNFGPEFNDLNWRAMKPPMVIDMIERIMRKQTKQLL